MASLSRRSIFRSNSHGTPTRASSNGLPSGSHARSSIGNNDRSLQPQLESAHVRNQDSPRSDGRTNSTSPASVGGISQTDLGDDLEGRESSDDFSEDEEFDEECLPIVHGESSDSSDAEKVDAHDRKRVRPRGKTFKDSREVMQIATTIMHSHYDGPWLSWKMVPDDVKCFWWKQFQKVYFWKDRHAEKVRRNWKRKSSQHLRSSFKDGRHLKVKPKFVNKVDWDAMVLIWIEDEAFQKQSKTNKQNRASNGRFGKGSYAAGSKSSVEVAAQFKERHKRKMTQEELMKATFRKKKTKEWTGPGPKNIIRRYKKLYADYSESHPEGVSEEEKNMLWWKAAGGDYRGRLCYQGSLHYPGQDFRNPAALVPSPSPYVENATSNPVIQEQNAQIEALRTEVLQEKQRHQSETAQLHQTYAGQIQRLVDMQRPHLHQQQAPQYLPMQAPLGHQYMQQQAPTYTSLLLNSTTDGFASPVFGGLAPDGPIVSTMSMSTPYAIQAENTPSRIAVGGSKDGGAASHGGQNIYAG